jgi:hypothetical protein
MKAAQIVTIKSFSPMFKNDEEATNIHIVNVEEHGFDIVTQKSLYKIGDKALFIQPDYCLSNIPLFNEFIAPQGNPKKSKLGKNNRVRAIKFNFVDLTGNKVYSNGILIPLNEVMDYLDTQEIANYSDLIYAEGYDNLLGITKYEEPEGHLQGNQKGLLPNGMYKTDETNFFNKIKYLEKLLPCELIGTEKIDGSSCSIYWKSDEEFGICSRSFEKKLFEYEYEGFTKYYDKELKKKGWVKDEVFIEDIELYCVENNIEPKITISKDDWVQLGFPILEKLKEYGKPLTVRCEIYGQSLRGSGNKNNPHANLPKSIAVYGIDDYSSSICKPLPMNEVIEICNKLDLPLVPIQFIEVFNSIDELKLTCNNYFKSNLIEGVVIRTYDNVAYSGKFMNNEYDANK